MVQTKSCISLPSHAVLKGNSKRWELWKKMILADPVITYRVREEPLFWKDCLAGIIGRFMRSNFREQWKWERAMMLNRIVAEFGKNPEIKSSITRVTIWEQILEKLTEEELGIIYKKNKNNINMEKGG